MQTAAEMLPAVDYLCIRLTTLLEHIAETNCTLHNSKTGLLGK